VPIGIISAATGSSSDSCWVPKEIVEKEPFRPTWEAWKNLIDDWDTLKEADKYKKRRVEHPSNSRLFPTGSYNSKLYGLFPMALTGVIWYQGEENRHTAWHYKQTFPIMISHWRRMFERKDLPFIQVQMPELDKNNDPNRAPVAELREVQWNVCRGLKNVYCAVIIDTGQKASLHPSNKQLPGLRLASIALARVYGKDVLHQGPTYKKVKINDGKVVVLFDHADGLQTAQRISGDSVEVKAVDAAPKNFFLAGDDCNFLPAEARIVGKTVELSSKEVDVPRYVRYAWLDNPEECCNLYNGAGFPAVPFRTDDKEYISKGKYYTKILLLP
ncbi:sialate O-acetylesterase, partial [Verrucomicrobiota bacterium]